MGEIRNIGDLKPDPNNSRRHNPRNIGQIVDSLHEVGASRSIVINDEGYILAGNGVVEAAALAGIENVQVVDVDGETIVAVRRKGLTKEQQTRLALFDNRTAELAEWDTDQLKLEFDAGMLEGMFSDIEANILLGNEPGEGEWGSAFDKLPDEDRAPFQQMTFTLHDTQAEIVKDAIAASKTLGEFVETENENSNGNALARICEMFLGEHGQG